jgi:predicted Zn-dependent peptidase
MSLIVKEYFDRVRSFNIGVFFKVGSYLENKANNGITHLIEHMVFKRTKNRSSLEISREIEKIGGSIDAFTSKEVVGFYSRVDKSFKDTALDILSDVVLNPVFDETDLEKEKEVIYEELKMREDNPLSLSFENFEKIIFNPSPYSLEIGGNIESVKTLTREQVREFYNKYFVRQNAVVSLTGNYDENSIDNDIEKYFTFSDGEKVFYPEEIAGGNIKDSFVSKDVQQANFVIGFKSISIKNKQHYALYVLMNAIASGMSSILFQRLREEEGLVYAIGNASDHYFPGGYEAVYASASPDKYLKAIRRILETFREIKDGKIEKYRIEDSKTNIIGQFSLSLESPLSYLSKNAKDMIFYDRIREIDELVELIKKSEPDFTLLKDLIVPENIYISTVAPKGVEKIAEEARGMVNEILS